MRPPHDIVFKYTHRETARLIIFSSADRSGDRPGQILPDAERELALA
jgi:hypothetical protein